jgi:hypothetical protein
VLVKARTISLRFDSARLMVGVSVGRGLGETEGEGWRFFDFGVAEARRFLRFRQDREGVGEGVGSLFSSSSKCCAAFFWCRRVGLKIF